MPGLRGRGSPTTWLYLLYKSEFIAQHLKHPTRRIPTRASIFLLLLCLNLDFYAAPDYTTTSYHILTLKSVKYLLNYLPIESRSLLPFTVSTLRWLNFWTEIFALTALNYQSVTLYYDQETYSFCVHILEVLLAHQSNLTSVWK